MDIIHHARKSLLYNNDEPWLKKESGLFDVTMGAYDGAEICELVGIFLQSRLINFIDKHNIGLYRDDGLAILRNISGPQSERVKKAFQKVFNDYHLKLEIKCNVKIVNYLDLTLNLIDGSHRPFHKPNDETLYINANSNHPPCIIKQTPIAIENRLRLLSSSEKIFNEAAPHYQNALEKSGYSYKLSYKRPTTQDKNNSTSRRNRKRQIIWFNPPYNKDVTTNIGKYFLNLIKVHFAKNPKLHKLFNRNNLKLSYSCMPNIKSIVNAHNKHVIYKADDSTKQNKDTCNCRNKSKCPLNNQCLSENVLYTATITSNLPNYDAKRYVGVTALQWKYRFNNHNSSFSQKKHKTSTELSKAVWHVKDEGGIPKIEWGIVKHLAAYNPSSKRCQLCIGEKLFILENENSLLNKRDELVSKCRHENKYLLKNHDTGD